MADTTTVTANDVVPSPVSSRILGVIRSENVMANLVYQESLVGTPGLSITIPTNDTTLTMTSITTGANEGAAGSTSAVTTSAVTLTAASKAVYVEPTKLVVDGSAIDLDGDLKYEIARTMATSIDALLTALLAVHDNTCGSTGADLTYADLMAGYTLYLAAAQEFSDNCVLVIHSTQYGDVVKEIMSGAGAGLASIFGSDNGAMLSGMFGGPPGASVAGSYKGNFLNAVPVFVDGNVPLVNTSADRGGAFFRASPGNKDVHCAYGMVWKWMPAIASFDEGVNMKLTTLHQGVYAAGVSEMYDALGVSVISDA